MQRCGESLLGAGRVTGRVTGKVTGRAGAWRGRPRGLKVGFGEMGSGEPLPWGCGSRRRWQRGGGQMWEVLQMLATPDVLTHPRSAGGLLPSPCLTLGWPETFRSQSGPDNEQLQKAEGLQGAG